MNLHGIVGVAAATCILASAGSSAGTLRDVGSMAHKYQLVQVSAHGGVRNNLTCPASYVACVSPTKSSPYTDEWCSPSGSCSLLFSWYWSDTISKVGRVKKKIFREIRSTWSPNPGGPSVNTISDNRASAKGTKIIAAVAHSACEVSSGSCFSNFAIYGVTN